MTRKNVTKKRQLELVRELVRRAVEDEQWSKNDHKKLIAECGHVLADQIYHRAANVLAGKRSL